MTRAMAVLVLLLGGSAFADSLKRSTENGCGSALSVFVAMIVFGWFFSETFSATVAIGVLSGAVLGHRLGGHIGFIIFGFFAGGAVGTTIALASRKLAEVSDVDDMRVWVSVVSVVVGLLALILLELAGIDLRSKEKAEEKTDEKHITVRKKSTGEKKSFPADKAFWMLDDPDFELETEQSRAFDAAPAR